MLRNIFVRGVINLAAMTALSAAVVCDAEASTPTVLHSFVVNQGGATTSLLKTANGPVVIGADVSENISGTVYKLNLNVSPFIYSTLHTFCAVSSCTDGVNPATALVKDTSGNLYGAAFDGGANNDVYKCHNRCGVVYEIDGSGNYSVLYNFCSVTNCADGANPIGSIVLDTSGNIFGVTRNGGTNLVGTIYKLSKNVGTGAWTETVVRSFCDSSSCPGGQYDGSVPSAGLAIDSSNNLYGTALVGGGPGDLGTLFKVTPSGSFTVLHVFGATSGDGWEPNVTPTLDASGNIYGETRVGGLYGFTAWGGTLWKYSAGGSYSVLYNFCTTFDPNNSNLCTDGNTPQDYNGVVLDTVGNIYGTTSSGGYDAGSGYGQGVIWKYTASSGTYHNKYDFCPTGTCTDGAGPVGGLMRDSSGLLYGVTAIGGANGSGEVYSFSP